VAKPLIGKLAIFGVGLIGGSFALALREAGAVGEIVGVGRSTENLRAALDLGVIDRIAADAADAVDHADLVLLAMPVGQMGAVMRQIAPHLTTGCAVTDAGSTKQDVVALARSELAGNLSSFVPGHPIAGAEKQRGHCGTRRTVPRQEYRPDTVAGKQPGCGRIDGRRLARLRRPGRENERRRT